MGLNNHWVDSDDVTLSTNETTMGYNMSVLFHTVKKRTNNSQHFYIQYCTLFIPLEITLAYRCE